MEKSTIRRKIISLLKEIFEDEKNLDLIPNSLSIDDKIQMLTSESMLALIVVTSIEDEFEIEFEDDEIDVNFFSGLNSIVEVTERYIKQAQYD